MRLRGAASNHIPNPAGSPYLAALYIERLSMLIYFLRHGAAAARPPDGSDSPDRPLTAAGATKIEAAGYGMRRLGVKAELLLTSPLLRARHTAEIIGLTLGLVPEITELLAPGMDATRMTRLLEQRNVEHAIVVGHEPDLSLAISALTGGGQLALKKGGLALVELPPDDQVDGTLHWLLPPKALRS
jgi:phosphohistidine phosphatase